MQKRRLLKLAAMLQADAKNKKGIQFNIDTLGRPSEPARLFEKGRIIPLDCGTTACAMGLAALSGKFERAGLSYLVNNHWISQQILMKWKGRLLDYDKSAMKLFNITLEQAYYLFSPWTYPKTKKTGAAGEREVVRRIKRIVAGKKVVNL